MHSFPPAQGLYDAQSEHDACGVAFVATLTGVPSHKIVAQAIEALRNLEHRGAAGAEPNSGDGAGILIQIPDRFLRAVVDFPLPPQALMPWARPFCPETRDRCSRPSNGSRKSPLKKGSRSWGGGASRPIRRVLVNLLDR